MSMPAAREMPVVTAVGPFPDRTWTVLLPGGLRVSVRSQDAAHELVKRHAPGSAVKFIAPGGGWRADQQ